MMGYLRSGLRASHTAEELFLGSGPQPAQWWLSEPPPRGPNGETLVYGDSWVRLLDVFGQDDPLRSPVSCQWELAQVAAAGLQSRPIPGGYTIVVHCGTRFLAGPYLVTPNQVPDPAQIAWTARVNGVECGQGTAAVPKIEGNSLRPGDFQGSGVLGSVRLKAGDVLEVEAEHLGTLRQAII